MAMKTRSWLGVCALLVFAGCTPNGNSNGGAGAPAQQSGAQNQPMVGNVGTPTSSGMTAPMILNLRGPDPVPAGGNLTLDVEIVVNEPIATPVTLRVLLPKNVQLVGGQPEEVLQLHTVGKLYRQYTVVANGPLAAPISVVASAPHPNGRFGFTAKRDYPARTNVIQPQPLRPPVGRPAPPPRP